MKRKPRVSGSTDATGDQGKLPRGGDVEMCLSEEAFARRLGGGEKKFLRE